MKGILQNWDSRTLLRAIYAPFENRGISISRPLHNGKGAKREPDQNLLRGTTIFVNFAGNRLPKQFHTEICRALSEKSAGSLLLLEVVKGAGTCQWRDLGPRIGRPKGTETLFQNNGRSLHYARINRDAGPSSGQDLSALLERIGRRFDHLLVSLEEDFESATLLELATRSKPIFVTISQDNRSLGKASHFLRKVRKVDLEADRRVRPLLVLKKGEAIRHDLPGYGRDLPVPTVLRTRPEDLLVVPGSDTEVESQRRYRAQFGRIAREIACCRVGLVLSSGCAKGLAHIGVIQVLEEKGVEIDAVAGASFGAYVGACWASGYNGRQLEELARDLESPWKLIRLLDPVYPPRRGLIEGRNIERRLRNTLGNTSFSDLSVPLHVVGTNLSTLDREVLSEGDVVSAVRASCAMPGICVPVERDGETYTDGCMTDPLPIDVLEEKGIEHIIAVSTVLTPELARPSSGSELNASANRNGRLAIARTLNRHFNLFAPGNVLDTLMQSIEGSVIRMVEREQDRAEVLLQPVSSSSRWYEFDQSQKFIESGREEALAHSEQLRIFANPQAA